MPIEQPEYEVFTVPVQQPKEPEDYKVAFEEACAVLQHYARYPNFLATLQYNTEQERLTFEVHGQGFMAADFLKKYNRYKEVVADSVETDILLLPPEDNGGAGDNINAALADS